MRRLLLACFLASSVAQAAVTVTVNGTTHTIPQTNERGWGTNVTAWIQAISQYTLQNTGGTFTLTAEAYTGATYGWKVPYLKSNTTTPATAGTVRLAKTDVIDWRNNADGGNLPLGIDSSDRLTFNSVIVPTATSASVQDSTFTIYDNSDSSKKIAFEASGITTATTRTITVPNASGTLVYTASPTFSGTITTPLTASRAVVLGASNELAAATTTATEIGYVNGVTSAIQTQMDLKAPLAAPTFSGTITTPLTSSRAMVTGASNQLAVSAVTATELGYVSGVTSAIQTQINSATTSSSNPYKISNCSITASVAASALTVALKDASGSDPSGGSPCTIAFRNATATTGTYADVTVSAATSVVLSNGSSAGCVVSTACTFHVYAINNAGTVVLGIINGPGQDEGTIYTSTILAGSGNDDAANTLYTTATQTSKAIRLIGRVVVAPAGSFAWTNNPTEISSGPFNTPIITPWVSYTPTGTWSTNTTYTGLWRRVGEEMEIQVKVATAGAPTSATLEINLPTGYTMNTAKLIGAGTLFADILGTGAGSDSGTLYKLYTGYGSGTAAFRVGYQSAASGAASAVTQAAPFTFGAGDFVLVTAKVPITGWAP